MKILVLGGNGQLGQAVVNALAEHGHHVTAFARRPPAPPWPTNITWTQGDAMDSQAVATAATGQDAAVNAIGSGTRRPNTIESDTTRGVLAAIQTTDVKRYIGMSAGIVAPVSPVFDRLIRPAIFRNLYREHLRVEELIQHSNLDWTIVRPPKLSNTPARGYREATHHRPPGSTRLNRTDVAHFITNELTTHRYSRQAVFLASGK